MAANLSALLYVVSGVLFIMALRGLSHPTTSRQGNRYGMIGMAIAIVTTVVFFPPSGFSGWLLVLLGIAIGGGIGAFSASVFGRVVDVPGQPGKWEGFGVGLTWRTPWSGQLSVGAENVVTRGKNPFAPSTAKGEEEGTVPYVRYQQDL